jgi:hypothetical protein
MFISIGFQPFLLMQFLCRCWQKAFATAAFMEIVSHILHEHLSPKKAQNEHARQCPPYLSKLTAIEIADINILLRIFLFTLILLFAIVDILPEILKIS